LEGLAPVVTLGLSSQGRLQGAPHPDNDSALQLFFLTLGSAELEVGGSSQRIESPALVAVHASQSFVLHKLTAKDPNRLIGAHVQLTGPVATLFLEEFAQPRTVSLADDEHEKALARRLVHHRVLCER